MKKVAVIGIGKLGLCFALNLEKAGYHVLGIDINEAYVAAINSKSLNTDEPLVKEYLQQSKNFRAVTETEALTGFDADLIFIMVATPSTPEGGYDHVQVDRALHQIMQLGNPDKMKHLVIGCTVMPGYCRSIAQQMLQYNYTVSYNPEFIAHGSIIQNQQYPDQVLIGEANAEAGDAIEAVYQNICRNRPVICRMDTLSAEICKLATNCFLTMKISFANAVGDLAKASGADAQKILAAIGADSRIGNKYLQYGFGYGGPCLPRDNRALQQFAQRYNIKLFLSTAADNTNDAHLQFQLHEYLQQYRPEQPIVFEGVAYKKGTTIIEASQKLRLAVALAQNHRKVIIADSDKVIEQVRQIYGNLFDYQITT